MRSQLQNLLFAPLEYRIDFRWRLEAKRENQQETKTEIAESGEPS
jgi:hypothetical protein